MHGPLNIKLATLWSGNEPCYALKKRLSGPQAWSGCYGEEKSLLFLLEIETCTVQPIAYSLY